MIISEKQMQLMDLARGYKDMILAQNENEYLPNLTTNLLGEIVNQQSEEMKVID